MASLGSLMRRQQSGELWEASVRFIDETTEKSGEFWESKDRSLVSCGS